MRVLALALFLFAVGVSTARCIPKEGGDYIVETIENAAAVTQYKMMLRSCRDKARAAHSFEVYEQCADDVDAELCRTSSLRCNDGGRSDSR